MRSDPTLIGTVQDVAGTDLEHREYLAVEFLVDLLEIVRRHDADIHAAAE